MCHVKHIKMIIFHLVGALLNFPYHLQKNVQIRPPALPNEAYRRTDRLKDAEKYILILFVWLFPVKIGTNQRNECPFKYVTLSEVGEGFTLLFFTFLY